MPNPLEEQLTSMARGIRLIQPTTPMPLPAGVFRVQIAIPGGQQMSVTETVTRIVSQDCELNLGWLTKDVRFQTPNLTAPPSPLATDDRSVVGGMPVGDVLRLNVQNVTGSLPPGVAALFGTLNGSINTAGNAPDAASLPGVPGVLGRIVGSVQIPIQTTGPVERPLAVSVRWRITDDGRTATDVSWTLNPDGAPDDSNPVNRPFSGRGGDVSPDPARALQPLQIIFPPAFTELTDPVQSSSPPVISRTIHASVRLQTRDTGISSDWIDLPPLSVTFPAIPVPTVLVLFKGSDFGDNIVIVVPSTSPLSDVGTVIGALNALNTTISSLTMPLPSTDPLSISLAALLSRLADLPTRIQGIRDRRGEDVLFRKADEIAYLFDVVWYWGILYIGRDTAQDNISSLIFIGPPRRRVDCFNADNFRDIEGQMYVTLGPELIAEISSLDSASPASTPPGRSGVVRVPGGARRLVGIRVFNDEFSSLRFGWDR